MSGSLLQEASAQAGCASLRSVLQTAYCAGLISDYDFRVIQARIADLLKQTILRFTGGESSSVSAEHAQSLFASTVYCLDAFCASFTTLEPCVAQLKAMDMGLVYETGLQQVRTCLEETKAVFAAVRAGRLPTTVVAYNDNIDVAIPTFFAHYDPVFGAHETPTAIDYPLASDETRRTGVLYIRQYVERLRVENDFCRVFATDEIVRLLAGYGRTNRIHYPDYLFNVFELVLTNALGSVLIGRDAHRLLLTKREHAHLRQRVRDLDPTATLTVVHTSVTRLAEELKIDDPVMMSHIMRSESNLAARLSSAIELDTLPMFFITDDGTGEKARTR